MAERDVRTCFGHGGWQNCVEGHPEETRAFATKSEAVHAGMALARALHSTHVVDDDSAAGSRPRPLDGA